MMLARVVDAERRLRYIGDRRVASDVAACSTSSFGRDKMNGAPTWPMVPSTSGWPAMADEDHGPALRRHNASPGNAPWRRAGRWRRAPASRALLGVIDHRLGNAVGAEHGDRAVGNFVQFLDEMSALFLQRIDHMPVVHDFVAHIDGLADTSPAPARRCRSPARRPRKNRGAVQERRASWTFFSHRGHAIGQPRGLAEPPPPTYRLS